MLRRYLGLLVRWTVTTALLALLLSLSDRGELARVLVGVDIMWFAATVLLVLCDRVLMTAKWLPLARVQVPGLGFSDAFTAYLASNFAGFFLPASIGGDVLRSVGVGRGRKVIAEVGASVAMERVLGMAGSGVVALGAAALAVRAEIPIRIVGPWALAAFLTGTTAVAVPFSAGVRRLLASFLRPFRGRRAVDQLERFGAAYDAYRGHMRTLLVVGMLSVLEQLLPVAVFLAAAAALQVSAPIGALLIAVPLTVFAGRLPISISGIGVVEGGMVYLLSLTGVSPTDALSITFVGRAAEILVLLPGALWWRKLTGEKKQLSGSVRQKSATIATPVPKA